MSGTDLITVLYEPYGVSGVITVPPFLESNLSRIEPFQPPDGMGGEAIELLRHATTNQQPEVQADDTDRSGETDDAKPNSRDFVVQGAEYRVAAAIRGFRRGGGLHRSRRSWRWYRAW